MIEDIRERANGIFLRALLVTKSLRDGLTNGDTMGELGNRLDSLPNNLEQLFKHILTQVDSSYHEKMLQIALVAQEPFLVKVYGFHDQEYDDEDYAIHRCVRPLEHDERLGLWRAASGAKPFQFVV